MAFQCRTNPIQTIPILVVCHGAQIRDFIKLYVGPTFVAQKVNCEIWSPTMNNSSVSEFNAFLGDSGSSKYISTVCFQYQGEDAIATVHADYPAKTLYETELECGSRANNWSYAEGTCFQQMQWYFTNGANGFMQWNMVLDQSNSSSWGWAQCAMITVDTIQKTATFHPQHYCAKHFSYYVKQGAERIKTSGTFTNQVGFKNPDGSVVVVANNTGTNATQLSVSLGTSVVNVAMPAHSFDTYVFYDSTNTGIERSTPSTSEQNPLPLTIIRSKNFITFIPHAREFYSRIVGIDGRAAATLSTHAGKAMTISMGAMAPGIYFVKGTVGGKTFTVPLFLRN